MELFSSTLWQCSFILPLFNLKSFYLHPACLFVSLRLFLFPRPCMNMSVCLHLYYNRFQRAANWAKFPTSLTRLHCKKILILTNVALFSGCIYKCFFKRLGVLFCFSCPPANFTTFCRSVNCQVNLWFSRRVSNKTEAVLQEYCKRETINQHILSNLK